MINRRFFSFLAISLCLCTSWGFAQKQDPFVLVIDAGHGGKDTGTSGHHEYEKAIALEVSLDFGKQVERKYKDKVKVIYTRKTDVFLELWERAAIANRNKADLFVSIHCNAAGNRSAKGTETFVMGMRRMSENIAVSKRENSVVTLEDNYKERYTSFNPNDPESVIMFNLMHTEYQEQSINFADLVEKNFVKRNRPSRGVKQNIFHVLRETAMPSVLIELGFISNVEDAAYLNSRKGKNESASAIYDAFKSYKKEWDRKNGIEEEEVKKVVEKKPEKPNEDNWYKIHFFTSKVYLNKTSTQLKGIANHEVRKENGVFKYYYGSTDLGQKRDQNLAYIKRKGFKDAMAIEVPKSAPLEKGYYTIQIMDSSKKYRKRWRRFKKLGKVDRARENGRYIYYYGKTNNNKDAVKLLRRAQKKGFPSAFIALKME